MDVSNNPPLQNCYDFIATLEENPTGPLRDHPGWNELRGDTSILTYTDAGRTVNVAVHSQNDVCISLSESKLTKFKMSAKIYGEARTNDWDIPITATNDINNTIGIRRSQGTVELMRRFNGNWGSVHNFGVLPEEGTELVLEFDNGHVRAGIPSLDLWHETDVSWTEAYPAIRTHTRDYDGVLGKNYKIDGGN
jgi:hypothetical protein